jgi:hypothetical protein
VQVGKERWTIEDGVIHGQGVTDQYGYLRTEKMYRDFWFSIRFKCEADGNSGVYFRTDFKPGTAAVSRGLQVEIDRTINHHNGGLYGDGRAWIAWPSPEFEQVLRPTDWNEMLLKVEGNHYQVVLNGIKVLDFTDPRATFERATSPCSFTRAATATCASRTSGCATCTTPISPRPRRQSRRHRKRSTSSSTARTPPHVIDRTMR